MDTAAPSNVLRQETGWNLDNSYARLPSSLFVRVRPMAFPRPQVAVLNEGLARELGLDFSRLSAEETSLLLSGQQLPAGSDPIAQAYAGHQYGGFTMLGDGRAILLGEQITPSGARFDLQWKGSGPTPYSRRGDGRAALGPMLREYIISEAMHALGIPTTRSLAVVTTGDTVYRETPLPGAVLIRVAASHIRVGTFQLLAARRDEETLKVLADYTIDRHDPQLNGRPDRYLAFLREVIARQARLIARWQQVGFVHGVMNTDNMALSGETIDYGPCAFLDTYHPETVFSSIDHGGRYAYGNQPAIAQWNLTRFAETLIPLIAPDVEEAVRLATGALNEFPELYEQAWLEGFRQKLGLRTADSSDRELVQNLLEWMESTGADFTNTFCDLADSAALEGPAYRDPAFVAWRNRWVARLEQEGASLAAARERMQTVNPQVIPRNERVEEALLAATQAGDLEPVHRLVAALVNPFTPDERHARYRSPPAPGGCRYRTFCGT